MVVKEQNMLEHKFVNVELESSITPCKDNIFSSESSLCFIIDIS